MMFDGNIRNLNQTEQMSVDNNASSTPDTTAPPRPHPHPLHPTHLATNMSKPDEAEERSQKTQPTVLCRAGHVGSVEQPFTSATCLDGGANARATPGFASALKRLNQLLSSTQNKSSDVAVPAWHAACLDQTSHTISSAMPGWACRYQPTTI